MTASWCCPICRAPHAVQKTLFCLSYSNSTLNIYRCNCGLRYSDYAIKGIPADVYDKSYYEHPRYCDEAGRSAYIHHLAKFFCHAVGKTAPLIGRRSIDVGCATGDFVSWMLEHGWQAEGIDIAEAAVARGRERGLPLRVADMENLFAEPETYDVITLWDVLEHLPDTVRMLAAVRTALKPNGLFLLKTASCTSLIEGLAGGLYRVSGGAFQRPLQRIYVPGHLYYYTPAALRRHLTQEGWTVICEAQSNTPAEALFRSEFMRLAFRGMATVQTVLGRNYELLVACRKTR